MQIVIQILENFLFHLKKVEIPPNSNLQTIELRAFYKSNIKEIYIPPTVLKINENVFESKVSKIGECAFKDT